MACERVDEATGEQCKMPEKRKARTEATVFTESLTDIALYFAVFEWMRINFVQ